MKPVATRDFSPDNYSTGLTLDETANAQNPDAFNPDLVVNGDFAVDETWVKGTGWTIAGDVATKVAGVASDLEQTIAGLDTNASYLVITTATRTAGTLTPSIGGNDGAAIAGDVTRQYDIILAGSDDFAYVADDTFAGTIVLSKVIKILEAQVVLKATKGVLYSLHGHNNLGSAQYILIFKLGAAADDGNISFRSIKVAANADYEFALPIFGDYSTSGWYVCNSTTNFFKTLGLGNCTFVAQFK